MLLLTPTRELCVQVTDVFKDFGKGLGVKTISVYGGVGIEPQIQNLRTADIVCATPGRTLDHIGRKTIDLSNIKTVVLDETDKMFEMGFIEDVEEIICHTPGDRQTLMFSATIFDQVFAIMKKHLRDPVVVRTKSHVDTTKLRQVYYDIHYQNVKFSLLYHLIRHKTPGLAIVFCATREESDLVARNLRREGINAKAIHGGMAQNKRLESLESLKNEEIDVLVATDVAARGLDIKKVSHIYNYDVPKTSKDYLHRIGRTARAGEEGDAVTLLTQRDHDNFRRILRDQDLDMMDIERAEMPHFKKVTFIRDSEGYRRDPRDRRGPRRSGRNYRR